MGKVKEKVQAEIDANTELVEYSGVALSPAIAKLMGASKDLSSFSTGLPYLKLHHSMSETMNPNHVHLHIDGNAEKLEAGYKIVMIDAMAMYTHSSEDATGKRQYRKAYDTEASAGEFKILQTLLNDGDRSVKEGVTYLVALLVEDKMMPVICTFECTGIQKDYWKFLKQSSLTQQRLAVVGIANHAENHQVSAAGNKYLDPKKFRQVSFDTFSPEGGASIVHALNKAEKTIETDWAGKEAFGNWDA